MDIEAETLLGTLLPIIHCWNSQWRSMTRSGDEIRSVITANARHQRYPIGNISTAKCGALEQVSSK